MPRPGIRDVAAVAQVAIAAGREIMAVYGSPFDVEYKNDSSPVTLADIRAECVIIEGLRAIAPDIPVIAEESAYSGRLPEASDLFFLVDPLDGTREFVARNGEFTVNIALVADGAPVLGVIFAPATGELVYADADIGAFAARIDGDGVIVDARPIRARAVGSGAAVALVSRSHRDARTDAVLERMRAGEVRGLGSSLKFCRIAAGEADLYPRHGPTMQWDTAAGDAILRAAGGCVVALDGAPLQYARRPPGAALDFANPEFCALGDPAMAALLRDA
ncbi:MAG: 3'(2'),5'-bisphosphate nucleotidase [Salinarimonadaceae bacterium]|nr:MAG: 3'(2'),5'-bisphosphate nucleotidase [Salinarimonadaceae bacterium]